MNEMRVHPFISKMGNTIRKTWIQPVFTALPLSLFATNYFQFYSHVFPQLLECSRCFPCWNMIFFLVVELYHLLLKWHCNHKIYHILATIFTEITQSIFIWFSSENEKCYGCNQNYVHWIPSKWNYELTLSKEFFQTDHFMEKLKVFSLHFLIKRSSFRSSYPTEMSHPLNGMQQNGMKWKLYVQRWFKLYKIMFLQHSKITGNISAIIIVAKLHIKFHAMRR